MEKIFQDKNFFQRVRTVLFLVFFLLLALQTTGISAESLEEGAKREGKLVFSSNLTTRDSQTLIGAFQKKYPFVKPEFYHSSENAAFQRVLREKQMGQTFADVLSMNGTWVNVYKKEGLLEKYISPESNVFAPGFRDPEGFWAADYTAYYIFIYNTKMVAKKDVPKTYEDLLNPMWKKKIGSSKTEHEWYMGVLDYMGEEKGRQFMRALAKQDLSLRTGRSLAANLMVAGEFPLALGVVHRTLEMQKDKAPLDMMHFPSPVLTGIRMVGIAANAPHPNAARLFEDFLLSKEGQTLFNGMSRHPVRMDVQVDPVVEKIRRNLLPIKPRDADVVQRYVKEYDQIFLKRQ